MRLQGQRPPGAGLGPVHSHGGMGRTAALKERVTGMLIGLLLVLACMAATMVFWDLCFYLHDPQHPRPFMDASARFADQWNAIFMRMRDLVMGVILLLFVIWAYLTFRRRSRQTNKLPAALLSLGFCVPVLNWFIPFLSLRDEFVRGPDRLARIFYFWWAAWVLYSSLIVLPGGFAALAVIPSTVDPTADIVRLLGDVAFWLSFAVDLAEALVCLSGVLLLASTLRASPSNHIPAGYSADGAIQ